MFKKIVCATLALVFITTSLPAPPSVYSVHQQTGHENSCPYVSVLNLGLLRGIRAKNNGHLAFSEIEYRPKWRSYLELSDVIHGADETYANCLESSPDFKKWVEEARKTSPLGFQNIQFLSSATETTAEIPFDQDQFLMFFPTLFKDRKAANLGPLKRGVPVLMKGQDYYVYFEDKTFQKAHPTPELEALTKGPQVFGEAHIMLDSKLSEKDQWKPFHEVGLYKLLLLALGIHRDHRPLNKNDSELEAFKAFQKSIQENSTHPWKSLRSTDLLEVCLAALFKEFSDLKTRAMSLIDFYFEPWAIYKSFNRAVDLENKQLRDKYLPGENQMLAYYFSVILKYLWAASIGDEALNAVMRHPMMGAFENRDEFSKKRKEFLFKSQEANSTGDSFLGLWSDIKLRLYELAKLAEFPEIIAYASHACVLSFDENLQEEQFKNHDNRAVAEKLGFVIFDSLYDREFKPPYRKVGQAHHEIEFYEGEN